LSVAGALQAAKGSSSLVVEQIGSGISAEMLLGFIVEFCEIDGGLALLARID
jgi:hypothetical protein